MDLICIQCQNPIHFTKKDEDFYSRVETDEYGNVTKEAFPPPRRCKDCRNKRRAYFDSKKDQEEYK